MRSIIFAIILIFLASCSFAADKVSIIKQPVAEKKQSIKEPVVEKKQSIKEQIEALTPEDPRRQKVIALTWQIQYRRERLKNIELRYLTKCYQDKEYRNALTQIEQLNKQMRQLLLL